MIATVAANAGAPGRIGARDDRAASNFTAFRIRDPPAPGAVLERSRFQGHARRHDTACPLPVRRPSLPDGGGAAALRRGAFADQAPPALRSPPCPARSRGVVFYNPIECRARKGEEPMSRLRRSSVDRRTFIRNGAGAALALGALPLVSLGQDRRLATVGGIARTRAGRVRGLLRDGVHQFWCVPYGAPTSNENRFMPPRPPAPWSGVKDHFEITFAAPIEPGAEEPAPVVTALNRHTPESEDCLTVNVFTPGLDNEARPVMVWMHGGGFSVGSGNYLLYDGTNLAKKIG